MFHGPSPAIKTKELSRRAPVGVRPSVDPFPRHTTR